MSLIIQHTAKTNQQHSHQREREREKLNEKKTTEKRTKVSESDSGISPPLIKHPSVSEASAVVPDCVRNHRMVALSLSLSTPPPPSPFAPALEVTTADGIGWSAGEDDDDHSATHNAFVPSHGVRLGVATASCYHRNVFAGNFVACERVK